ncbi:MAG: efflux RND transporter periplasmic adaptor subunit [Terriglobales bacterium]
MRFKRSYFVVIAAVITVVGWLLIEFPGHRARASREDPSMVPTVAVALASRGPIRSSITLSGAFRPYQEVDVHAKVAGYIRRIYVDVGDKVQDKQTLAILEVPELNAQVAGANADIRRSEDAIRRAEHDVKRAESTYTAYHAAYTRLKQASAARPGLIAEQELDDSMAHDHEAEAQVGSARAALAEAQSRLSMANATMDRYASLQAYSRITAPFSGVVTKRYADTGALIQAGTASDTQSMPVVRLAEWSRLRLVVPVPESAVPDLQLGQAIDVAVPALGRTFKGKVARFADSLNEDTRTMHTEIDVENKNDTLVGGMYAETTLVLHQKDSVLTVPIQAVKRTGTNGSVFVVDKSGTVGERSIKLGVDSGARIEVISGVSDGDQVIVGNLNAVQTGQRVRPKLVAQNTAAEGQY